MLCATGCNGELWVFKVEKWVRVGRSGSEWVGAQNG